MAKELTDTIQENAQRPAEVSGDSGSVKQHQLRDQMEADRYLNSKQAAGVLEAAGCDSGTRGACGRPAGP